jgi:hypothetical protein
MYSLIFEKYASPTDVPVWAHIPGTPFTLPGRQTQYERLPGMTDWAPRPMVTRVAKGLSDKKPLADIVREEGLEGRGRALATGGIGGGIGGGLLGRLLSGGAGTAPLREIASKGLSRETIQGLSRIPKAMWAAPLLGSLLGAGLTHHAWAGKKGGREQQARDVSRGLLAERLIQNNQLRQAIQGQLQGLQASSLPPLIRPNVQTAQEPAADQSVTAGGAG